MNEHDISARVAAAHNLARQEQAKTGKAEACDPPMGMDTPLKLPAWHDVLCDAEQVVRQKPTFAKYIKGTVLENDVPVWMATFAQQAVMRDRAARGSPQSSTRVTTRPAWNVLRRGRKAATGRARHQNAAHCWRDGVRVSAGEAMTYQPHQSEDATLKTAQCEHRYLTSHGRGLECSRCGVGILSIAVPLPMPLVEEALRAIGAADVGASESQQQEGGA